MEVRCNEGLGALVGKPHMNPSFRRLEKGDDRRVGKSRHDHFVVTGERDDPAWTEFSVETAVLNLPGRSLVDKEAHSLIVDPFQTFSKRQVFPLSVATIN